jgi:hypothetical protein
MATFLLCGEIAHERFDGSERSTYGELTIKKA